MTMYPENESAFQDRHIGPRADEVSEMLAAMNADSLEAVIDDTIPSRIRRADSLKIPAGLGEHEYLNHVRAIAGKNKVVKSLLGQGYFGTIVPSVIKRNVFENPGWYTQYTPYQPEIAQGRLEALLNFQTMVMDLTAMEVANASLLDEGTAAAEAMSMLFGIARHGSNGHPTNRFFVSDRCLLQTFDVVRTRALPLGIEVVRGDHTTFRFDNTFFGTLIQYPAEDGEVLDYRPFVNLAHEAGVKVVVATDLLALAMLKPPGEFGADVAVGNSQRFGVPLGFGGPHAAFFATKKEYIRSMPGRIIGVSVDSQESTAYRMTLQTREQHIRREKATSNICTAEALLAIMAGFYGAYHGPEGIRRIAARTHERAAVLASRLGELGFRLTHKFFFDTLRIETSGKAEAKKILAAALAHGYNLRTVGDSAVGISLDETVTKEDVDALTDVFRSARRSKKNLRHQTRTNTSIQETLRRSSPFMTHPVFQSYHSEHGMMRYIKGLENKDLSLVHSMIPLGSCTMKLNAATELMPVSWDEFSSIHPFAPAGQVSGYRTVFAEMERMLCEITGLHASSLQPNSGAQGELTGLLVICAYHADHKAPHRNIALIPSSAHGTNPASAVMAGMKVVVVQCDEMGNIDVDDLRMKAESCSDSLGALMVTYPSTHGVFEERIQEICSIVHKNGGLVYMDGANMNAQVGLTSPALIGADVCHINLHKTFSIPHGGGGPGMGPICVSKALAPYLPGHFAVNTGGSKSIPAVASAPWSSASILLISYGYMKMLGGQGMTDATRYAILNANYLKARLEQHFPVLYQGKKGRVAHEFILNMKQFKEFGVEVEDIAKRLMDYGFHAPTVSFPVAGTMMIEPTESESKTELDRFTDALISIRKEIQEIADGHAPKDDNLLKNAPHTARMIAADSWTHPYSRTKAAYPLPYLLTNKFWPSVGRIDNTYGDRNLVCSCPPVESYEEVVASNAAHAD